ncbi:DNA repair protein RadA [Candidatus Woesebacteria bacterium]|nr:DNA repair protein RadA [Candidatus Woesebacteria bacterium]
MAQYICSKCGYGSASWYGKCPSCQDWNTFEKTAETGSKKSRSSKAVAAHAEKLSTMSSQSNKRLPTLNDEFDRVLGGGFVQGEVVLLAGEPGVGKSTLLLSVLGNIPSFYISGEESGQQVKQRADRLGIKSDHILFTNELQVDSVIAALEKYESQYEIAVIDSIQTLYTPDIPSPMGSVSQIKENASRLVDYAKRNNKIIVFIGHVTKDGDIAGPKTLEHLVDCVVQLEGEKESTFRLLRARKNRFGSVDEVGLFEMSEDGLKQVTNPSLFIDKSIQAAAGRAVVITVEGSRSLLYEVQSLVVPTQLAIPRRIASGVDYNRLQLLLAVIRKNLKMNLDKYDIYVSVAGGLTIKSPSADLGIAASIISSVKNTKLPLDVAFVGEIGLLGEVRSTRREKKIMFDAKRLGLKKIISSDHIHMISQLGTMVIR